MFLYSFRSMTTICRCMCLSAEFLYTSAFIYKTSISSTIQEAVNRSNEGGENSNLEKSPFKTEFDRTGKQ